MHPVGVGVINGVAIERVADGRVGSRLATELLARGHTVTGIERNPGKLTNRPGLEIKQGDATNPSILVSLITGHDAVVGASRVVTRPARRW